MERTKRKKPPRVVSVPQARLWRKTEHADMAKFVRDLESAMELIKCITRIDPELGRLALLDQKMRQMEALAGCLGESYQLLVSLRLEK